MSIQEVIKAYKYIESVQLNKPYKEQEDLYSDYLKFVATLKANREKFDLDLLFEIVHKHNQIKKGLEAKLRKN